jgi:hypothetical protein
MDEGKEGYVSTRQRTIAGRGTEEDGPVVLTGIGSETCGASESAISCGT